MQSSFEVEGAALLAERLSSVTRFTIEFGAGQSHKNLEVVATVFDTLAQSDVNEQVYCTIKINVCMLPVELTTSMIELIITIYVACFSYEFNVLCIP